MKYRSISVLILMFILASSIPSMSGGNGEAEDGVFNECLPTRNGFQGGNGTIDDPYQVSNVWELQNISMNLTEHFVLVEDIDASATRDWNGGEGFRPLGVGDFPFKGSLDGSGFEISDLWIDLPGNAEVGLFGSISEARIHHVEIDAAEIRGYMTLGILTGNGYQSIMENCTVSGKLTGSGNFIGGLLGNINGDRSMVRNCTSDADITVNGAGNKQYVGGLIGRSISGSTDNCISKGDLLIRGSGSFSNIGGSIGYNTGTVENCNSQMDIEIEGISSLSCYTTGGLIGQNGGNIVKSSWTGFMNLYPGSGTLHAYNTGGLTGYNGGALSNCFSGGLIKISGQSYNTGGLSGNSRGPISGSFSTADIDIQAPTFVGQTGGLVGSFYYAQLIDSYSTGSVDISVSAGNSDYTGGLIGDLQKGEIANCYSKSDVSATATGYVHNVGGLIGYCNQGAVDRTYSTGALEVNLDGGYTQTIGGLVGQNNIGEISNSYSTGSIKVTGNGNAFNIGGLAGSNNRGMSYVYSTVPIDISVSPTSTEAVHSVGGLIGYNSQSVEWAYAEGDITCNLAGSVPNNRFYRIGGLIGENMGGFISKVYSRNNISKTIGTGPGKIYKPERIGGLIGYSSGRILYSFSMGSLSINESEGGTDIGGLVGFNDGDISESYVMRAMFYTQAPGHSNIGGLVGNNDGGEVPGSISDSYTVIDDDPKTTTTEIGALVGNNAGTLASCFYDKEVFAYDRVIVRGAGSADHSANTTTEMKKEETFQKKDWDFINSWGIIEDRTYPWLYPLYRAPVIKIEKREHATEDEQYLVNYQVEFSNYPSVNRLMDPEMETSAIWLSHNKVQRTIYGIPTNDDVGFFYLNLSVEDLVGETEEISYNIQVVNVNDPPLIITENIPSVIEDEPYSRYYFAIDVDPVLTEMVWSMKTNARWLEFEENQLYGTPLDYDIGIYWVNISVMDTQGAVGFTNFTLTVESANDAPVITTVPVTIAIEDEPYVLDLTAEDEDENDRVTWTLEAAPEWILFTRSRIKGTPTNDDVGLEIVRLKATDLEGATDELSFMLEVKNTNDAPMWVEFPDYQEVTEGDVIVLNALAEDVDLGDQIFYNITSDPGCNISIHPRTGTILWDDTEPGNYTINVSANDGVDWTYGEFNITVKEKIPDVEPHNHLPQISSVDDKVIEVGNTLTVQITATDEDEDALLFDIEEGADGMVVSNSGRLVWTPSDADIGFHPINISVSDSKGVSYSTFSVEVKASSGDDDDIDDDTADDDTGVGDETELTPYIAVIVALAVLLLAAVILIALLMRKKGSVSEEEDEAPAGEKNPDNTEEE